jgi:hypothetical protein
MSEEKTPDPTAPDAKAEGLDPSDFVQPNTTELLRDAYKKAKEDGGGKINISMSDVTQAAAEIPATFKSLRRGKKYTGGQIFLSLAFLFSVYVASGGEGGFSLLAFLMMFTFLWLVSAPFRMAGWAVRRANSRPCPVCGIRVANGETQCQSCGTDFTIR